MSSPKQKIAICFGLMCFCAFVIIMAGVSYGMGWEINIVQFAMAEAVSMLIFLICGVCILVLLYKGAPIPPILPINYPPPSPSNMPISSGSSVNEGPTIKLYQNIYSTKDYT